MSIAEAQIEPEKLQLPDGSPTPIKRTLDQLNVIFTVVFTFVFTVELLLNFLSQPARDFLSDAWSLFDTTVVLMSLIVLGPLNFPISMLRALRVVRLFGRLESSKKILAALSVSLVPMCNAFFIMLIVAMICEPCTEPRDVRLAPGPSTPRWLRGGALSVPKGRKSGWWITGRPSRPGY